MNPASIITIIRVIVLGENNNYLFREWK